MKIKITILGEKPSNRKLKIIFIASTILLFASASTVIQLLESSRFPGELEKTQLGFDAEYIRDCFNSMNDQGLSRFILGNLVDYLFMASYGGFFFSIVLLVTRKLNETSISREIGYIISLLGLSAAIGDGLENIFLLSMASNPVSFPAWLAFYHSLFAHIKFKLMYLTAGWITIVSLYLVSAWILNSKWIITMLGGLNEQIET